MKLTTNHIIIYFDSDIHKRDGEGWCVESSDSEMTVRFGTLAGALAYASTEENWMRRTNEGKPSDAVVSSSRS